MHFSQLLPCILASATVAVAQLVPVGPIATFYSLPDFQGHYYIAGKVGECLEFPANVIGNVSSVKLQQLPAPFYISCTLFSNDYCRDPAASAIYYATSLFSNNILANTTTRSAICLLTQYLP